MSKGHSAIVIDTDRVNFYKSFLSFMKPVYPVSKLRNKQLEVLAVLLYHREKISAGVTDNSLIPKILFSPDTRKNVLETCNISSINYYGIMAHLKKLRLIENNDLSKKIIPEFLDNKFTLIVSFNLKD